MIFQQSMSLYELLSLVVSVCSLVVSFGGLTLIGVSFYYLTRQTRELTSQTKYVANSLAVSAFDSLVSPVFQIDQLFFAYPELRPYFYSGKDINEDDSDYDRVIAIAEYILDCFDVILINIPHIHHPPEYVNVCRQYIIDSFANSPILCKYHESMKTWWVAEQNELKRKGEDKR